MEKNTGIAPPITETTLRPGTWHLDPGQTDVSVEVKAMFGLFTVKGTMDLLEGSFTVHEDPSRSHVELTVDATSFSSGNSRRDQDVKAEPLLHASAYPEITFSSISVQARPDGIHLTGVLEAHGEVDQDVGVHLVRLEPTDGGSNVRFRAETVLDRTRFGIVKKKGMVGREVVVSVEGIAVAG